MLVVVRFYDTEQITYIGEVRSRNMDSTAFDGFYSGNFTQIYRKVFSLDQFYGDFSMPGFFLGYGDCELI